MRLLATLIFIFVPTLFASHESQFLDHLQDELEDYLSDQNSAFLHSRVRRDIEDDQESLVSDEHIKCKQESKKQSCCGKNNVFKKFADSEKGVGKTCYEEVSKQLKLEVPKYENVGLFSCEKYKLAKKLHYCTAECIGKKKLILQENGTINKETMKTYLMNEIFKEEWQKDIGKKALVKCMDEKYIEWPENEPGMKCNPVALQFQHCLWKEYELNCPTNEQKENKKCNRLRNHLKEVASMKKQ